MKQTKETPSVLVAVSDVAYGGSLARQLTQDGCHTDRAHDAQGVLRMVARRNYDAAVLDLDLGKEGTVELVSYVRRKSPNTKLVLLFELTQVDRALEGIRRGAFFYLPKQCLPSDVALVVGKALRARQTESAAQRYERDMFAETIGASKAMHRVVSLIAKVAPTDSTVLLLGESGTGKEVLANAIHRLSQRREMPFIAINCAALPEPLLESEMFGHVKGAFTGADADKRGLFEEASSGTIFLDEVGDMALITQAKLLRVLQDGEIRRVGASTSQRVDVRVIAATNRDLEQAVARREFREDLYFRLNVIQIRIPPLRDRMDALPKLVGHFVERFAAQYDKPILQIDDHALALLRDYRYPGNVRELQSILEHAVILADDGVIRAHDLPEQVRREGTRLALPDYASDDVLPLTDREAQAIRAALARLNGNQTEVARRLGISRSTLWRKMKEYGISG